MSWPPEFIAYLQEVSNRPVLRLRAAAKLVGDPLTGSSATLYSHLGVGGLGDGLGGYQLQGASVGGQAVYLRSWQVTDPSIAVEVSGGAPWAIAKGTPCELDYIMPDGSEHRIAVGVLRGAAGTGGAGTYRLDIGGPYQAMRSRVTSTRTEGAFAHNVATTSTIATTAYTSGDTSLELADATDAVRRTGDVGLIAVTPTSGADFYLRWTNKSGNILTVESTAYFGSTLGNAAIGQTVTFLAIIQGHPMDVFRWIWSSTGAGTNGAYDVLPASWGLGLPDDWLDHDDIDRWKALTDASSHITLWTDAPVEDPGAWVLSALSLYGIWPVMRQGSVSLRCFLDAVDSTVRVYVDDVIEDSDIIDIQRHELWDPDAGVAYARLKVTTDGGSYTLERGDALSSLPVQLRADIDISSYSYESESNTREDVANRGRPWYLRESEAINLVLTREWAKLAPGDVVTLASRYIVGRDGVLTADRPRKCMVLACDWSPLETQCTVRLSMPPDYGGP